jgi:site-specific DNA-methyltransferase (adenine-specific)
MDTATNTIYLSSVKYINDKKANIKDYDIDKLCLIIKDVNKYNPASFKVLLFVKNKIDFLKVKSNSNNSSNIIINYLDDNNIYDINDLEKYFKSLKILLSEYNYLETVNDITKFSEIYLKHIKPLLKLRFHQKLIISKSIDIINKNNDDKKVLIGALPRTGKSYIMGGIILDYIKKIKSEEIKNKKYFNFLIITPAPSETISQYEKIFNTYHEFSSNNIHYRTIKESKEEFKKNIEKFKEEIKDKNNVFIISIQKANDGTIKPESKPKEKPESKQIKDISDEDCLKWKKNKLVNPLTKSKSKIVEGGPMYKKFTHACSHIKTPELKEGGSKKFEESQISFLSEIKNAINPSIIFIDEAHFAMSSEISKKIIERIGGDEYKNIWKFLITATYNKPIKSYKIIPENKIYWNIDDVIKLQRIANNSKYNDANRKKEFNSYIKNNLINKFDENIINDIIEKDYSHDNNYNEIINEYKHFPEPYLITTIWSDKDIIYKELDKSFGTNYTFNMRALFGLKNKTNEFENKEQLKALFHYYFGYPDKTDKYKYQDYFRKKGIIPRINSVCNNYCRTKQERHKTSQLWFLPSGQGQEIKNVILTLLPFLKTNFKEIFDKTLFMVAISENITDKDKSNVGIDKDTNIHYNHDKFIINKIEELEHELNSESNPVYENLIILTAQRLKLGVSLPNVDIVVLFNSIENADTLYQIMFRSMTEVETDYNCDNNSYCPKKKYGFIVDLNPQRTLTITDYIIDDISYVKKDSNINEKRTLITDLFNIDRDIFGIKFDDNVNDKDYEEELTKYTNELFTKLSNEYDNKISNIIKEMDELDIQFDINEIKKIEENLKLYIYNIDKLNKQKTQEEGVAELNKKKKILIDKINEEIKDEAKAKEIVDNIVKAKQILAEFINILAIISTDTIIEDKELIRCILNGNEINKISKFKYELLEILEEIRKEDNEDIKMSFIHIFNERTNKQFQKNEALIFHIIEIIINSLKEREEKEDKKMNGGNNLDSINKIIHKIKSKYYSINEPDKLLDFINDNLKPNNKRKKENGEVFTPMNLVNEMLDKLPEEVWSNPHLKWLDPAAGMGNFPIAIYLRLMKGLKKNKEFIKTHNSDEEIKKWILTNMLYMIEYDRFNVFMLKKILCGNKYPLNIFHGSFIDSDRYQNEPDTDIFKSDLKKKKSIINPNNKIFEDSTSKFDFKFNIIIGNPPFNDEKESPIYNKFIDKSLELTSRYLLFIIPSRWFSGGRGLSKFRENMLKRKDIKYIKHYENSSDIFGNKIEITGGISYFLIDKTYEGLCNFCSENNKGICSMIQLNKYDILIYNSKYYTIINKLIKYENISKLYKGRYFNIKSNDKRLSNTKKNSNYIKCYVSQQKGNIKYIDKTNIKVNINNWKVITSESYGASKYFGNIFIGKPNEVYTQSYISFEVKNETEANSLKSYLKTKLANFMLSLRKNTQHISEDTIKWIPLPPLDREWNNDNTYKYFELKEKEIKIINSSFNK